MVILLLDDYYIASAGTHVEFGIIIFEPKAWLLRDIDF
jgi:hypothetical protein